MRGCSGRLRGLSLRLRLCVCMHACMYVCMSVCLSVHNKFTIEIYGFSCSLLTFLARAAHGANASAMEDSEYKR